MYRQGLHGEILHAILNRMSVLVDQVTAKHLEFAKEKIETIQEMGERQIYLGRLDNVLEELDDADRDRSRASIYNELR